MWLIICLNMLFDFLIVWVSLSFSFWDSIRKLCIIPEFSFWRSYIFF